MLWQNADSIIVVLLSQAWLWAQLGVNSSHCFSQPIRAIFLYSEGFHDLEVTFLQLFAYLVYKVYSHCLKLLMKGSCHRGFI